MGILHVGPSKDFYMYTAKSEARLGLVLSAGLCEVVMAV